ncbi:MAG: TRAP transporter fused permease subunit [Candidatus Rokubacteria bacterium]|nr:TRAP transporter fused permease subunit [Candidatus Rokubacteria bacterium]
MGSDQYLKLEGPLPSGPADPLGQFLDRGQPWSARWIGFLVALTALTFSVYQLFTGYFAQPQAIIHRVVHVTLVMILALLVFPLPAKGRLRTTLARALDGVLLALVLAASVWILRDVDGYMAKEWEPLSPFDVGMAILLVLLVLEAVRRTCGLALVIVVIGFNLHALFADRFPWILYGPPTPLDWLLKLQAILSMGIFGLPIMVMASYLTLFIILAVFLSRGGGAQFFLGVGLALFGRQAGGPAKVAVVSSGLFGTISGSAVANVVVDGQVTIPMMKRIGFQPHVAGAVEAVASSGGQIMPPVMGATAFVMAEIIGVKYATVAVAAAVPAILYYVSLFLMVHFEARKLGLRGLAPDAVPRLWRVLRQDGYLVIPLITLIGLLAAGSSIIRAGFWSVVAAFLVSFVRPHHRMNPRRLLEVLIEGAGNALPVSTACAGAGLIIGAVTASGLGDRLSSVLISAAGGQLWLALLLTMLASFILGMGLTTTADYIVLATLVVPALVELGAPLMSAHLFAFYFSSISGITPPVALAAFAAAGIANASLWKTGSSAVRIGLAAFIVPYMFVYGPELTLVGAPLAVAWAIVTATVGICALAVGIQGWLLGRTSWAERALCLVAAPLLIKPGLMTDLLGFVAFGLVFGSQIVKKRRVRAQVPTAPDVAEEFVPVEPEVEGVTDHGH